MTYEVKQSRFEREWIVEATNSDGEIYVTAFSGPEAESRAREYATWQTGRGDGTHG